MINTKVRTKIIRRIHINIRVNSKRRNPLFNYDIAMQNLIYYHLFTSRASSQTRSYFSSPSSTPFNKELDVNYKLDKLNKVLSVSFNLDNLYDFKYNKKFDYIKNLILNVLSSHCLYTTYIKIRYSNNLFMMAGNQFGFKYTSDNDLHELIDVVVEILECGLDRYQLDSDEVVYIQLLFRKVNTTIITEFSKEDVRSVDHTDKGIKKFNTYNIPISVKDTSLGSKLNTTSSNGFRDKIEYIINGVTYNFMDKIVSKNIFLKNTYSDKITKLSEYYNFYLVYSGNIKYILALLKISETQYKKIIFSLSGNVLSNITDTLLEDNTVLRKDGNISYHIKDGID